MAAMAWELAPLRPPALESMCVHGMVGDSRGLRPGALRLSIVLPWNMLDFGTDLHRRSGSGGAPIDLDEAYRLWEFEHGKWLWYLPLADLPESRLGAVAPFWRRWLASDHHDTLGFHDRAGEIDVPILHVGGWYDMAVESVDLYTSMARAGRSEQRLVVGPWTHSEIGATTIGDLDFGAGAATTFAAEATRWFDRRLRGDEGEGDNEPPVKLFVMGANRWRAESEWPLARAETTTLYLSSGGNANTPRGDGRLVDEAPADGEPPDEYVYDPHDPVPTLFLGPYAYGAPFEQGPLDHRRDVLVYQTGPLAEGLEVTGHVEVALYGASSARDTDWTAKLVDVHPDGRAYNVTHGFLRARFRESYAEPSLLERHRVYEFRITLHPTSMLFLPGHRLRLDISSSDFPAYDRNHNTGGDDVSETELVVARQRVFHDGNRASRLLLPTIRS
jgi:putative CocE/NonD family hydrolase